MTDDSGLFDDDEEEYPLISSAKEKRLENRAIKEGWVQVIDDNFENMVKRQVVDSIQAEKARDRTRAFSAVAKVKTDHEASERAQQAAVNVNIQNNEGARVRITLPDNGRNE